MRKQWYETEEIDRYLFGKMVLPEKILFQARMLISPLLKSKVAAQDSAHEVIRWYGRNERRKQLEALHDYLMHEESFRIKITSLFK